MRWYQGTLRRVLEHFTKCVSNESTVCQHHPQPDTKHNNTNHHRDQSLFYEDAAIDERFRAKNADFLESPYDRGHMVRGVTPPGLHLLVTLE